MLDVLGSHSHTWSTNDASAGGSDHVPATHRPFDSSTSLPNGTDNVHTDTRTPMSTAVLVPGGNDGGRLDDVENDESELTLGDMLLDVLLHATSPESARRRRIAITLLLFVATALLLQTFQAVLTTVNTPSATYYFTASGSHNTPLDNLAYFADDDPWLDTLRSMWAPRYQGSVCKDARSWDGHEVGGHGRKCKCQDGWIGLECNIPVEGGFKEPQFAIIGVQKGGTSSLHMYMKEHKYVLGAAKYHYFDQAELLDGIGTFFASLTTKKVIKAPSDTHHVVGTGAPKYIYAYHVPQRMYYVFPNIKLILLMREPFSRMWSAYNFNIAKRPKEHFPPFAEELSQQIADYTACLPNWPTCQLREIVGRDKMVGRSLYYYQLMHWLRYYQNPKQYLLLQSERMFSETQHVLDDVSDFIGIPRHDFGKEASVVYNKTPKKKTVVPSANATRISNEFMTPHVEDLYALMRDTFDTNWTWPYVPSA
eukprot:TRINITY_DN4704_c0_g1_i1.p1 TRINITY_DN4704_c0_g1~~TRINITY_DN4704_c0_g1_i1.p1  ORF type:complete len:480 (+),score=67.17 TRINITY_DN4704_c0_g1_i1:108-1547(+)